MSSVRRLLHSVSIKLNNNGPRLNVISNGHGAHPILCIPGALGTATTDFTPQLEDFGGDGSEFTVVSFDPRGYGQSRPPNRTFQTKPIHFLEQDAIDGHSVMSKLGFTEYSVLGWSDGGVVGIHIASMYPEVVKKLVIWGANAYFGKEDIECYENTRDISKWSKWMRKSMESIYGDDLAPYWCSWIDSTIDVYKRDGNLCIDRLPLITCPTLVLHGEKDPMVPSFHPRYLLDNINGSVLHTFPDGGHNVHLKFRKQFHDVVKKFILS